MYGLFCFNGMDMFEATRLTQAGRLDEATVLIQRSLFGDSSANQPASSNLTQAMPTDQSMVLDEEQDQDAMIREKLMESLNHLWSGLRDGALPALKGLTGWEPELREPPSETPSQEERFIEGSFRNDSGSREYKLFIPNAVGKRPLVVMLHGCSQSPDDFAAGTRMNELASEEGFYVVYPRQPQSANVQKCWNWFQPHDQERGSGEADILAEMTRSIMTEHAIDSERVYIAGLSAGGAAASNIALAYPDVFAAVGVHSGLAAGCAQDLPSALTAMNMGASGREVASDTSLRIPTIVLHGNADMTVNPLNGQAILDQAGAAALKPQEESGEMNGRGFHRTRYVDETGRVQVESWLISGAGHAWSGGSTAGSFADSKGPNASRAMMDFFREHSLAPVA